MCVPSEDHTGGVELHEIMDYFKEVLSRHRHTCTQGQSDEIERTNPVRWGSAVSWVRAR